jgi:hypothetical protein
VAAAPAPRTTDTTATPKTPGGWRRWRRRAIQPVGVLEVTDDETRLVPILDYTRIITTGLTALGVWMVFHHLPPPVACAPYMAGIRQTHGGLT